MVVNSSQRNVSLMLTTGSVLLAVVNIQLGRRLNYLEHLPAFNALAAGMLALAVAALVVACLPLLKARGRDTSSWLAAFLAILVIGLYLLDQ